jgi:hypothetical protein
VNVKWAIPGRGDACTCEADEAPLFVEGKMGTGGRARSACLVGRWGRGLEDCIALYSISLRILGKGERERVAGLDGLDGRLAGLGLRLGLESGWGIQYGGGHPPGRNHLSLALRG